MSKDLSNISVETTHVKIVGFLTKDFSYRNCNFLIPTTLKLFHAEPLWEDFHAMLCSNNSTGFSITLLEFFLSWRHHTSLIFPFVFSSTFHTLHWQPLKPSEKPNLLHIAIPRPAAPRPPCTDPWIRQWHQGQVNQRGRKYSPQGKYFLMSLQTSWEGSHGSRFGGPSPPEHNCTHTVAPWVPSVTRLHISAGRTVTKWNIFSTNTSVTANFLSDVKSLNLQALAPCRCWNKGLETAQGWSRSTSQCVSFGQALLTSLQIVWHLRRGAKLKLLQLLKLLAHVCPHSPIIPPLMSPALDQNC